MRHNRQTHRFGRSLGERQAMLENLVTSLLRHQEIKTTVQKAKAAKRLADHLITLGKKDSLASRREVFSYLQDHELTSKIFKDVAPRFKNRNGGYTRILQLPIRRKGDGADLALLELTEKEIRVKEAKKEKKKEAKDHKGHAGHEHEPKAKPPGRPEAAPEARPKAETKKEKPIRGFFKNIGKFFRNKGGG